MANERKAFTVEVNSDLSKQFSAQTEQRGYFKYRAIEGALRAFMALPAEEQVSLMFADTEANGQQIDKTPEKLQKLKTMLRTAQSTQFKILSKEESQLLRELRRELGPESQPAKQKKKAGG